MQGNPVKLTDPFGLCPDGNGAVGSLASQMASSLGLLGSVAEGGGIDWSSLGHAALDFIGIVWDGADIINAVWYGLEGNYAMAAVSMICTLPFVGTMAGGSARLALKVIGHSLTFGMAAKGTWDAAGRAVNAYESGTLSGWNFLDVGLNALGMGLSGRAAFTNGRELAGRIAASETGQRIAKGIKQFAADNRGEVPWVRKSKGGSGVLENANYAQKTYSNTFSAEGRRIYSDLAGEPINTIDDLVNAINSGKVNVADLPVEYIVRDGNTLI